jgi:large subunit ribosomal protein L1
MNKSKHYLQKQKLISSLTYSPSEALHLLRKVNLTSFVPSVDLSIRLRVPKKQNLQISRVTLTLPHGNGKKTKILVITDTEAEKVSSVEGITVFSSDEALAKREDFKKNKYNCVLATPEVMPKLSEIASILGPKKIMPSVKTGTVTTNLENTINEVKKGKTIYSPDKFGNIHVSIGRLSFSDAQLLENYQLIINNIIAHKFVKSSQFKHVTLSTTMSPALSITSN